MADVDQNLINHLRTLRMWAKGGNVPGADAAKAVGYLDAAGVFDAIDSPARNQSVEVGGDVVDFSGSVFNGPFVGKSVTVDRDGRF
jgi:hypothetical protein